MSLLTAINAFNAENGDADFSLSSVAVTPSQTFIQEKNRVAFADGVLDLPEMIAHHIHHVAGTAAVTEAHLDFELYALWGGINQVFAVLKRSNDAVDFSGKARKSDLIKGNEHQKHAVLARKVAGFMTAEAKAGKLKTKSSQLVAPMIAALGEHRHNMNGHAWLTDGDNAKYNAYALNQADAFESLMTKYGHDILHFLEDDDLEMLVEYMVGIRPVTVGEANDEISLVKEMGIPRTVTDRVPYGTVGVAGLFLGIQAYRIMITEISARFLGMTKFDFSTAVDELETNLAGVTPGEIADLKNRWCAIFAMAAGYVKASRTHMERFASKKSFDFWQNHDVAKATLGALIHQAFEKKDIDDAALYGAIITLAKTLNRISGGEEGDTKDLEKAVKSEISKHENEEKNQAQIKALTDQVQFNAMRQALGGQ